jgi:hypothetical protein
MSAEINRLVEQRQLRLAAIDCLAQPLQGDVRQAFIEKHTAIMNRELPAPSRHHMRLYLKAVD